MVGILFKGDHMDGSTRSTRLKWKKKIRESVGCYDRYLYVANGDIEYYYVISELAPSTP